MSGTKVNTSTAVDNKEHVQTEAVHESSKVGTWISVGMVGAVILGTYFLLFGLYMDRF